MKNAIIPMVLSMACAAGLAGTSHAQDFASGNWVAVADGVWEQTSADGTVTRVAHGQAGANHDRQVLEAEIDGFLAERAMRELTADEHDHVMALEAALEVVPAAADVQPKSGGPQIKASQYNLLCGGSVAANLDTHLVVGRLGATAVARGVVSYDGFGPPLPPPTSGTLYSYARITPAAGGGSMVSDTKTVPFGGVWQTATANYRLENMANGATLGASACSAYTQSYTSFSGPGCTVANNYASLIKNYATCVTTP